MKTLFKLTLALALTLALSWVPAASADTESTKIHVSTSSYGEAEFELGAMEVGETARFATDTGEPITITRTEDGYQMQLADKEIAIGTEGYGGCDDGDCDDVMVKGSGDGTMKRRVEKKVIVKSGEDDEGTETRRVKKRVVKVESDDEGAEKHRVKKMIKVGGDGEGAEGDDIKIIKKMGPDGKAEVKVYKNGEEIDPGELHEEHGAMVMKMGDDSDLEDTHVIVKKIGDGEDFDLEDFEDLEDLEGLEGAHVIVKKIGDGEGGEHDVKVIVEKDGDMEMGEGDGEQIKIRVERRVEKDGDDE